VVTDDGLPPLSATNTFTVFVNSSMPAPQILSINVSSGLARISWSTVDGHSYRLQYKDGMSETNWLDVMPDVIASGTNASMTNAVGGAPERLYRIFVVE
jgi:hypothetical protein